MLRPTRTLPQDYTLTGTLDLSKNTLAMIVLNLIGLVLLAGTFALFLWIAVLLRGPDIWKSMGSLRSGVDGVLALVGLIGVFVLMVVLHEAVHGVFFWLFTGQRPVFGVGPGYAYAAAPDWFLPRRLYLWVGLSPLIVLSVLGVGLLAIVPPGWIIWLLIFLAGNASGAVGDMAVVIWLLRQPPDCLAQDRGDALQLYNRSLAPGEQS